MMIWFCSTARGELRLRRFDPDTGVEQVVAPLPEGTTTSALTAAVSALAKPGDVIAVALDRAFMVMKLARA